jgi:hypothetical protein
MKPGASPSHGFTPWFSGGCCCCGGGGGIRRLSASALTPSPLSPSSASSSSSASPSSSSSSSSIISCKQMVEGSKELMCYYQCCGSGSGSISQRYGSSSGSGSFYHQAKIVKTTLISTVFKGAVLRIRIRRICRYVFGPPGSGSISQRFGSGVAGCQPMSTAVHRSPNELWRSNCIFKGAQA